MDYFWRADGCSWNEIQRGRGRKSGDTVSSEPLQKHFLSLSLSSSCPFFSVYACGSFGQYLWCIVSCWLFCNAASAAPDSFFLCGIVFLMSFSGFAPGLKLLIIKARIFVFLSVSVVVLSFCHLSYCHILFYLGNYILNYFVPFLFLTSVLLVITSLVFKSLSSPLYSSVCLLCFPKLSPVFLFCFVPYEVFVVLYPFRFLICPCLRLVFVATCLSVSCIFFARIYYCLLYQSLTSLPNLPPVVSLFLPDLASHFHFVRL